MTDQPTLFDREHPHRAAYETFRRANPWLMPRFAEIATGLRRRGFTRYGMQALFEIVRYEWAMTNDPSTEFKINNNYAAFFARDLMTEYPVLAGMFETRKSCADES